MLSKLRKKIFRFRSEWDYLNGSLDPATTPRFVQIEPTVKCNLECVMCARTLNIAEYNTPDMTPERFHEVLDDLPALERIQFNGYGEPFLHKQLPNMILDAAGRGIHVAVNSNSTVWTEKTAEQAIKSGVRKLKLSIDSADPAELQKIRGVDLAKATRNIKILSELRRKLGVKNPYLSINCTVQVDNLMNLHLMFPLAEEMGVDDIRFKSVLGFAVTEIEKLKPGGDAHPQVIEALERARIASLESKVPHNFPKILKKLRSQLHMGEEPKAGAPAGKRVDFPRCHYPWFEAFISNEGDVRPCCKFYRKGMHDLGNIHEQSMKAIWHGEGFRKMREKFIAGKPIHPVCLDCDKHSQSRELLARLERRYKWIHKGPFKGLGRLFSR